MPNASNPQGRGLLDGVPVAGQSGGKATTRQVADAVIAAIPGDNA